MAKTINRLTAIAVKNLSEPGMYPDGGNLYLQVSGYGTKSWIVRFKSPITGKTRDMGIGALHDRSLGEARDIARDCRNVLAVGVDPIDARHKERVEARLTAARIKTFDDCATAYIDAHAAGWRNAKHQWQWRQTIEAHASPKIGAMSVADIETADVLRVLEPIWRKMPETAGRIRQRIERILNWATAQGYRQGDNPARWRGHLDNLLPKRSKVRPKQNYPALPYAEIGAFMTDLRARPAIAARALEFTIMTAARSGETLGARWDEIDFDAKLWTMPAVRMKSGKDHRVPLSDAALAVLRPLQAARASDFVFFGQQPDKPLSEMAMLMLLRRMGRADVVVHGFRSTFRDWTAERTNFPNHIAEMALAHTIGSDVEAAYRRGDLLDHRRRLMDAWAGYCGQAGATGDVVQLVGRVSA